MNSNLSLLVYTLLQNFICIQKMYSEYVFRICIQKIGKFNGKLYVKNCIEQISMENFISQCKISDWRAEDIPAGEYTKYQPNYM